MAIKKTKLSLKEDSDYTILGISCHLSDFRFIHYVNKIKYFNFIRHGDFDYQFKKDGEIFYFPLYYFDDQENYISFYVVSNRSEDGILMNEWKNFDYLLITKNKISDEKMKTINSDIKKISGVLAVIQLISSKKSEIENLISEIEIYVTDFLLQIKKEKNKTILKSDI